MTPHLTGTVRRPIVIWLIGLTLTLVAPAYSRVSAAQTSPDQATATTITAVSGTVTLLPADTGIEQPLGADTQSILLGDILGVGDDGEAGPSSGNTLAVRVFYASHVQIGAAAPDTIGASADNPASRTLGPAAAVYELSDGARLAASSRPSTI